MAVIDEYKFFGMNRSIPDLTLSVFHCRNKCTSRSETYGRVSHELTKSPACHFTHTLHMTFHVISRSSSLIFNLFSSSSLCLVSSRCLRLHTATTAVDIKSMTDVRHPGSVNITWDQDHFLEAPLTNLFYVFLCVLLSAVIFTLDNALARLREDSETKMPNLKRFVTLMIRLLTCKS